MVGNAQLPIAYEISFKEIPQAVSYFLILEHFFKQSFYCYNEDGNQLPTPDKPFKLYDYQFDEETFVMSIGLNSKKAKDPAYQEILKCFAEDLFPPPSIKSPRKSEYKWQSHTYDTGEAYVEITLPANFNGTSWIRNRQDMNKNIPQVKGDDDGKDYETINGYLKLINISQTYILKNFPPLDTFIVKNDTLAQIATDLSNTPFFKSCGLKIVIFAGVMGIRQPKDQSFELFEHGIKELHKKGLLDKDDDDLSKELAKQKRISVATNEAEYIKQQYDEQVSADSEKNSDFRTIRFALNSNKFISFYRENEKAEWLQLTVEQPKREREDTAVFGTTPPLSPTSSTPPTIDVAAVPPPPVVSSIVDTTTSKLTTPPPINSMKDLIKEIKNYVEKLHPIRWYEKPFFWIISLFAPVRDLKTKIRAQFLKELDALAQNETPEATTHLQEKINALYRAQIYMERIRSTTHNNDDVLTKAQALFTSPQNVLTAPKTISKKAQAGIDKENQRLKDIQQLVARYKR